MSLLHLFDAFTDANWVDTQINNNYTMGHIFQVTSPVGVTKLGWRRSHTGSTGQVVALALWDHVGPRVMVSPASLVDNGSVGWQWTALDRPYVLAPYHAYVIAMYFRANQYVSAFILGAIPTPPSPLAWVNNLRGYRQIDYLTYPTTFDAQYLHGVDVEIDTTITSPIDQPAGSGEIAQAVSDLEAYVDAQNATILSMVSNEGTPSVYSIPNQIKTSVGADLAGDVAAVKTVVDGIATTADDILNSVGAALATAVSTVQDTLSHASTGMVDVLNGVSSVVDDILNNASTGLVKVLNYLGGGGGALPPRSAVPATGWANVASTSFTDDIAWTQPADMYVVTFSDVGANDTTTLISGLDIVYRLAWWLPLNSTQLQGERRFIDAPLVELTDGGKRMPGLALHCPKGGAGTIDAWQYTP